MMHPIGYLVVFVCIAAIKFSLGQKSLGYWYMGFQILIWLVVAAAILLIAYLSEGRCA